MWDDVGDIIVAREDHKDITMQQVEAIAQFALKVQKLITKQVTAELADFENQDKKAKAALRCKFLQEEVSKEKFENFFVKYKVDKMKKKTRLGAELFLLILFDGMHNLVVCLMRFAGLTRLWGRL
jgi:hypothetical protein